MAESLTSKVKCSLTGTLTNTLSSSNGSVPFELNHDYTLTLTSGTSASMADRAWTSTSRSLSGATSEDIDMYDLASINIGAGAGLDPLGQSWATVEVVAVMITNDSTSTGNLTVGGKAATTAWNSPFSASDDYTFGPIMPGGVLLFASPANPAYAVADVSNHLLKIASSASATYTISILARSA